MNCYCGGNIVYEGSAQKNDQGVHVYKCDLCGMRFEAHWYKYHPSNCPRHQWEFMGWGFYDDQYKHELYWKVLCDRCGLVEHKRFDSKEVGLRQAIPVEHPDVMKTLELNEHTARFHLDDDEVKNFWGT